MRRAAFATTALLLAGCASSSSGGEPPPGSVTRSTTVVSTSAGESTIESYRTTDGVAQDLAVAPEKAWEVLPAVYESLGIPVKTTIPPSKTLGNTALEFNRTLGGQRASALLECGQTATGSPVADNYRINMSVLTALASAESGRTRVETRVNATATSRTTSGAPVNCATTGRLEARIAEQIRRLAGS